MRKNNLKLGNKGEKIAQKYLESKGYDFLEKNCQNKYGEIDLIMKQKENIVFVEVKTRTGERFGSPEDAVNKNKIRRLIKNSRAYIIKNGFSGASCRIDAVCVVLDENQKLKRINHYENITA